MKVIKSFQIESLSLPTLHFPLFGDVARVDINSPSDWLLGSWHHDLIDEKSGLSQIQYQERAITVCLTEQCDNNRLQSYMCIWRQMTAVRELLK